MESDLPSHFQEIRSSYCRRWAEFKTSEHNWPRIEVSQVRVYSFIAKIVVMCIYQTTRWDDVWSHRHGEMYILLLVSDFQNYILKLAHKNILGWNEIEILLCSTQTGLARTAARKSFQNLWKKYFATSFPTWVDNQ